MGPQALSQGHNPYTTQSATQIHTHTHKLHRVISHKITIFFLLQKMNKGKKKDIRPNILFTEYSELTNELI